jgi:hypothetical protein
MLHIVRVVKLIVKERREWTACSQCDMISIGCRAAHVMVRERD